MTQQPHPKQLRLIIETDDFDNALRYFRDVLALPEQPAFAGDGDDRVSILHAGIATIELATPAHARGIDQFEGVPEGSGAHLRMALEVDDTEATLRQLQAAGARVIAHTTRTPFYTLSARVEGPAGWQVTLFQELEPLSERAVRPGFMTDDQRES